MPRGRTTIITYDAVTLGLAVFFTYCYKSQESCERCSPFTQAHISQKDQTERYRLVLNWGGRETQLPTLKYACMWEVLFQNKHTTKCILYIQNSAGLRTHTKKKKMEKKLISFWIFFFPSLSLQIMIQTLRNLSGNIPFKNLWVFCLHCSDVKKYSWVEKKKSY